MRRRKNIERRARRRLLVESLEDRRLMALVGRVIEDAIPSGGVNNGDLSSSPASIVRVGNIAYFTADDGINGEELWRVNADGLAEMIANGDVEGGLAPGILSSSPSNLTNVNGQLFFTANDGTSGVELWRVNATGTAEIVEDMIPNGGIAADGSSFPSDLTNVNGLLYFVASDGINGRELWRAESVGFAQLVEDAVIDGGIRPGVLGSLPKYLTEVNGNLFFQANDGTNGAELWQVDGTGVARMVEDSLPGGGLAPGAYDSYPINLTNVNGELFFAANDSVNGVELWRTSGNSAFMMEAAGGPLGDGIADGFLSSYPSNLTVSGGTLFFRASLAASGYELWRLPLGAAFVEIVEDSVPGGGIAPGADSSYPSELTAVSGLVYFRATTVDQGEELWVAGPTGIAELVSGGPSLGIAPGTSSSSPKYITNVGGILYFAANDGTNGEELWRVPLSGQPAQIVLDAQNGIGIAPGAASSNPKSLTNHQGTLFFSATNATQGRELWWVPSTNAFLVDAVTNGVPAIGQGINPGAGNADPIELRSVGNRLFFSADDGLHGRELFVIDVGVATFQNAATIVGTTPTTLGINLNSASSLPTNFIGLNGSVVFSATDDRNGRELWRKPSNGPAQIVNFGVSGVGLNPGPASSNPRDMVLANGSVVFTAEINGETGLWATDGQSNIALLSTKLLSGGIDRGPGVPKSSGATEVNGVVFFVAADSTSGNELWRLFPNGSVQLVETSPGSGGIAPGSANSDPSSLINVNGTLYFVAQNAAVGRELWRVDSFGNAAIVEDLVPGGGIYPDSESSLPRELFNHMGTLYFQANDGTNGRELWRVPQGGNAQLVEDSLPGGGINANFGSYPAGFTNVNGLLYFQADDGVNGLELWRLANETTPPQMVEDSIAGGGINPGLGRSNPRELTNVNGTLYFSANNGTDGFELWQIDLLGQASMIEDQVPLGGIRPGADSSGPLGLTAVGDFLYFSANDGTNGTELWRALAGSATMIGPAPNSGGINPGANSSYPSELININGTLYFAANDIARGRELWAVQQGLLVPVVNTQGSQELNSGNFGSSPTQLTSIDNRLWLSANTGPRFGSEPVQVSVNALPQLVINNPTVSGSVLSTLTNSGTVFDADFDPITLTASLGTIVLDSSGSWTWSLTPTVALSNVQVQITARDSVGESVVGSFTLNARPVVLNRQLFYNRARGSNFQSGTVNPVNSIDPLKSALLPGQSAGNANYSNYERGLNGIVMDVAGVGAATTAADFAFATWNGNAIEGFVASSVTATVTQIPGGGVQGSTRLKIEFSDNALRNTWLRVTLLANSNTGLASPDVFYFGNAVGDMFTGNTGSPTLVRVNASDIASVRQNVSNFPNSAGVSNFYDIDKDGRVNATDTSLTRQNVSPGALWFFTAPAALTLASVLDRRSDSLAAPAVDNSSASAIAEGKASPRNHGDSGLTSAASASVVTSSTVSATSSPPASTSDAPTTEANSAAPSSTSSVSGDSLAQMVDRFFASL